MFIINSEKYCGVGETSELFGVTRENVNFFMSTNKEFVIVKDGLRRLNVSKLIKIRENVMRNWNISHDYYYFLNECGMTDADIAKGISKVTGMSQQSWYVFLSSGMFKRIDERSIFAINARDSKTVAFIEFCEIVIPKVYREKLRVNGICQRLPQRELYAEIYKERLQNYEGAMR